ncbi:MAG: hypothetical protein IH614_11925 [Desulfuromonadales bacterium]|nr:hypothetical protein [Desulfuromonadales bacterium]
MNRERKLWHYYAVVGAVLLLALLTFFRQRPPMVPRDEMHRPVLERVAVRTGSQGVEEMCAECHSPQQIPLPSGHPTDGKCLTCHPAVP